MDPVTLAIANNRIGVLSVLDFGARRDGVTSDSDAFAEAIAAAQPGQMIVVPPGRYYIDQEIHLNKSDISLVGFGHPEVFTDKAIHVISVRGTDDANRIENITVSGLTLIGREGTSTAKPSGIWTGPTGIEVMFANQVTVDQCHIRQHAYDGIGIPQSVTGIVIRDCLIEDCWDDGINPGGDSNVSTGWVEDVLITRNTIRNLWGVGANGGIGIHHSGMSRNGITTHNIIRNCKIGVDFTACNNWKVSENDIESVTGSDSSVRGVAFQHSATVKSFNISVLKNNIRGFWTGISVATGNLDNVQIEGNKLSGMGGSGIVLSSGTPRVSIKGNHVWDATNSGILVQQTTSIGCIIANNMVIGNGSSGSHYGIQVNGKQCIVTENVLQPAVGTALFVAASSGNINENNVTLDAT